MAIRNFSSEFNFVITFDDDKILFMDLEADEEKNYTVDVDEAEQLQRITGIAITDASAILGKIEQLRESSGANRKHKFKKIDSRVLVSTLSIILTCEDWRDVYQTICEAKYYQLEELCQSESPISYYNNYL